MPVAEVKNVTTNDENEFHMNFNSKSDLRQPKENSSAKPQKPRTEEYSENYVHLANEDVDFYVGDTPKITDEELCNISASDLNYKLLELGFSENATTSIKKRRRQLRKRIYQAKNQAKWRKKAPLKPTKLKSGVKSKSIVES